MQNILQGLKSQQSRENLQTLPAEPNEYRSGMLQTFEDTSTD